MLPELYALCCDTVFFFQAEDGIRDLTMTGVQTCALPISFVRDFIFPMLRGAAVYEGSYLLGTSIARPLIAQAQVEVARTEKADAVAHGATGKEIGRASCRERV